MAAVPALRIRDLNRRPVGPGGDHVLYWMTASRRISHNFSLDRAVEWCRELNRPLVVLEALRLDYPWASRRLHAFVLEGMADNQRRLDRTRAFYYPFVETETGAGKGLLAALAGRACLVVTDQWPCFFIPRMQAAAAARINIKMEAVDGCGLLPLQAAEKAYPTAHGFRRLLQRELPGHLAAGPRPNPFQGVRLPGFSGPDPAILRRWPPAGQDRLAAPARWLAGLPLDQTIGETALKGGSVAARTALRRFLDRGLERYLSQGRQPLAGATSGLSPYLHFGHISPHQVFFELADREGWTLDRLTPGGRGERQGWWGTSPEAEVFLDQLVTWRELGFNFCLHRPDYDQYESLPDWAQKTLAEHERDVRPHEYDLDQFARAATHDPLWNAAQGQLVAEGFMGNYLRMLWGKKVLHWTASPRAALAIMIELNNRFALDGRDPNSYSGIFWCLGRYDRPWGPVRPVFGRVRYMSSRNTARKLRVSEYVSRYGGGDVTA